MLSTFCFIVALVAVAYVSFKISDFVYDMLVAQKIYTISMWLAKNRLLMNGRGFFEDKNIEAIDEEWSVRVFLAGMHHIVIILLILLIVPSGYKLWEFPGLAIKIGVVVGLFMSLVFTETIELIFKAKIGRLMEIDEKNIGHFHGDYCKDFDVDLLLWKDSKECPLIDKRYLVLDILKHKAFSKLDI